MLKGKFSRWLWLGLGLNLSIMVWRFWSVLMIARLPYRPATDWIRAPEALMYLIFYGLGLVGIQMAVTGDRRPLLFWDIVYLVLLVPDWEHLKFGSWSLLNPETLIRYPNNLVSRIWIFGAVLATVATYIGHRRMRLEKRTSEAAVC